MGGINLYTEILKNKYPDSVGTYVVSSSLLKPDYANDAGNIFAQMMADYIGDISKKGDLKSLNFESKNISIINALTFLQKVIENERNKETMFISYIQKETNESAPTTASDWKKYVLEFQQKLQIGNQNLKILQYEYERLMVNKTASAIKFTDKNEKEKTYYDRKIKSISEYTKIALTSVVQFLSGKFENRIGKNIISFIIQQYGANLFQIKEMGDNITMVLNPSQVSALMIGISQILIETFFTNRLNKFFNSNEESFSTDIEHNFSEEIKKILEEDKTINIQIEQMIKNIKQLPFIADNIAHNYKIPKDSIFNIKEFTPIINNLKSLEYNETTINNNLKEIMNLFKNIEFAPTIKLVGNINDGAELSSAIKQAAIGSLTFNTGGSKAKPDNVSAKVIIEIPENSPQTKIVQETLELINKKVEQLTDTLKQTNTTEYYNEQNKNWTKTANEIEKLLNYLKEKYNILSHCFLIEDSTKNYTSLETPGDIKHGFEGGSLGANIEDQINKIAALQQGGLINNAEAEWLITAAINCGPNLIGSHIRESLQDYLSAFATILLFDDQQQIANEITEKYINSISSSQTTVTRLHLFSLNNGYYPLSFVLQLTYEKLLKLYGFLDSELNKENTGNNGAKVTISGFINPDNYYPPNKKNNLEINSWDSLSQIAKDNVKMSIIFLTNFSSLVSSLLNQ